LAEAEEAVVCRRCCGEVCLVIWEAVDAAAGAEEDSAAVEASAAVGVDLAAALAEAATLEAEARVAVGKILCPRI
jgi:hypothetical protein